MLWHLRKWAAVAAAVTSCGVQALSGALSDSPEHIKLSLATGNAADGRMKVMWVTKTCRHHAEQSVRFGLSASVLTSRGSAHQTVADSTDGWNGCIVYEEMAGLRPKTIYYYSVDGGKNTKSSAIYCFKTPSPTTATFAIVSDLGSWDWAVKTTKAISADTNLNAVLSGGDLDYADGNKNRANTIDRDLFGRVWQPVFEQAPFQSAIGDHEAINNGDDTGTAFTARYSQYYGQATATRRWWSLDICPVHAIFVDTVFAGSVQPEWHSISGKHVPKPGPTDPNRHIRNNLEPLYIAGKVDFVYSGHEHSYERTFPVRNFTVMGKYAKDYFFRPTHPINIVTGATGIPKAPSSYGPKPAWVAYRLLHNTKNPDDGRGVGWLRAAFTQSDARFNFYRTMDGKVVDSFLVRK